MEDFGRGMNLFIMALWSHNEWREVTTGYETTFLKQFSWSYQWKKDKHPSGNKESLRWHQITWDSLVCMHKSICRYLYSKSPIWLLGFSAERCWDTKAFSVFNKGYKIFLIAWNYPLPWYLGLKLTVPLLCHENGAFQQQLLKCRYVIHNKWQ